MFDKLKNWRRIATLYDKTASSYLGFITLAAVKFWMLFGFKRTRANGVAVAIPLR
jgi:hypothetical protein